MAKKTSLQPTAAELEILQILWKNGPSTVRFVNENLNLLGGIKGLFKSVNSICLHGIIIFFNMLRK